MRPSAPCRNARKHPRNFGTIDQLMCYIVAKILCPLGNRGPHTQTFTHTHTLTSLLSLALARSLSLSLSPSVAFLAWKQEQRNRQRRKRQGLDRKSERGLSLGAALRAALRRRPVVRPARPMPSEVALRSLVELSRCSADMTPSWPCPG